jgi:transcriptional regulator with XRE-family HTH domain
MEGAPKLCADLLRQSAWDETARRELASLCQERDPEIFFEGLLNLAGRREKAGHDQAALSIYENISDPKTGVSSRAQARRDALLGHGAFGARAEVLSRRFFGEATAPAGLLAMAGAQAIFSITRSALLLRLLAAPASPLTRGFAARALASVGGFALEAPAFVALGRGARLVLGENIPHPEISHELAASYLSLGMLKLGGAAIRKPGLLHDGAQVAGLMSAHALESRLGLRPASAFGDSLIDSLVTLLQLKVGGRALQGALGEAYAIRLRELDLRSRSAGLPPLPKLPTSEALAGTTPSFQAMQAGRENILRMEEFGESGAPRPQRSVAADRAAPWRSPILDRLSELQVPEHRDCLEIEIYDKGISSHSSRAKLLEIELRVDLIFRNHSWLSQAEVRLTDGAKLVYYRGPNGYLRQVEVQAEATAQNLTLPDRTHALTLFGEWQSPSSGIKLPERLSALREGLRLSHREVAEKVSLLTGEPKAANTIRGYESSSDQAIPLRTLKALSEVYRIDLRELIAISNQTRFPEISPEAWSTGPYPLYIEDKSDLRRLEYFERADPGRKSFGWIVYSQRKNPFRYFYTRDFRNIVGMESGIVDAEENRLYPSLHAIRGLAENLQLNASALIDAANRTFHPELNMAALFPGMSLHLDPNSQDAALVQGYAKNPGTLGQTLFAFRKSQASPVTAREMSRREGFAPTYWREAELGFHEPKARDWPEWYRFLKSRQLSLDSLKPWLSYLDRFQENAKEAGRRLGPWTPKPTALPLQDRLLQLREARDLGRTDVARLVSEMTGEPCLWTGIRGYEEETPRMSFRVLRALAEIYQVDVRDLVVDSNRGRFSDIPESQWRTPRYPIYLERDSDVERLQFFRKTDPKRQSLGWAIFAGRKNPLHYLNLSDLEASSGLATKALGRLETNQDYPTPRVLKLLTDSLAISESKLLEAANRTFHPSFPWSPNLFARHFYLQPHSQDAEKLRMYLATPNSLGQKLFEFRKSLPGHPSVEETAKLYGATEKWWNERELNQVGINSRNRWKWEQVLDRIPELKNKIFGISR